MDHFIQSSGYEALFLLALASAACVPIPSEVFFAFAGVLAAEGRMNLAAVIAVGSLGTLVGAFLTYAVGRTGGRALVDRLGRYVLLTKSDLDRAERWFERRGELAVLVGRVLPVLRSFISLPAGVAEMNVVRFGVFSLIGSVVWCAAVLASIGYGLGGTWHKISHDFSIAGYVVAVLAVLAIGVFVLHRLRVLRQERNREPALTAETTET